jgi:hypothetical protein
VALIGIGCTARIVCSCKTHPDAGCLGRESHAKLFPSAVGTFTWGAWAAAGTPICNRCAWMCMNDRPWSLSFTKCRTRSQCSALLLENCLGCLHFSSLHLTSTSKSLEGAAHSAMTYQSRLVPSCRRRAIVVLKRFRRIDPFEYGVRGNNHSGCAVPHE